MVHLDAITTAAAAIRVGIGAVGIHVSLFSAETAAYVEEVQPLTWPDEACT